MPFVSRDPATGRRLGSYRPHTRRQIDRILDQSAQAARGWRKASLRSRAQLLRRIAGALEDGARDGAPLICAEMGKPITQALAEIRKSALVCRYYAEQGPRLLLPYTPEGAPAGSEVVFEPLGTLLGIMPWNFPYWQVFRSAAPALMAGNAVIVKHAANVSGCAVAIEALVQAAGAPKGLLTMIRVEPREIARIIADDRIAAVTLTGSTEAGRRVAMEAGRALKKGVYELGGSDPYIVLEDADLPLAAETCAASRLINSGQSCVSAKRFIVAAAVRGRFESLLVERMRARRVGSPMDPSTDVGPLARRDLVATLDRQVQASVAMGARVLLGGRAAAGPGNFYEPTVLTAVAPGMPAYDEELFGPVASVISAPSEARAIAIANATAFGLGAAVFSRSKSRARRVASQLDVGTVAINDFVKSDPALPFGGVKASGFGRELGTYGLREFLNIKTLRFA